MVRVDIGTSLQWYELTKTFPGSYVGDQTNGAVGNRSSPSN